MSTLYNIYYTIGGIIMFNILINPIIYKINSTPTVNYAIDITSINTISINSRMQFKPYSNYYIQHLIYNAMTEKPIRLYQRSVIQRVSITHSNTPAIDAKVCLPKLKQITEDNKRYGSQITLYTHPNTLIDIQSDNIIQLEGVYDINTFKLKLKKHITQQYSNLHIKKLLIEIDQPGITLCENFMLKIEIKEPVFIPEGVIAIDKYAFINCVFSDIILPKSLEKIYITSFANIKFDTIITQSEPVYDILIKQFKNTSRIIKAF